MDHMKVVVRIDKERCKGCELCVSVCKTSVLVMSRELNAKAYHFAAVTQPDACTGCRRCALICPDAAIEIDMET
ncbi:MAG: tungsten formylmethanofuran dehydrogenase [Verrucomicrobia bacterium]|nr:tungsten formylmethanofuran dehydrogenase [Verrucomicrobiota bacterium]